MIKILHSIVSPDAILETIRQYYPVIKASSCELLELGCNDNYRLYGPRRDFVFRLYRFDRWPEKDIDDELRLLETLHRKKVNVCKPVRFKTVDAKTHRYDLAR